MRVLFTSILSLFLMISITHAQEVTSSGVIYFQDSTVSKLFQTGGRLLESPDYKIITSHREGPGQSEIHMEETDIFYVVNGSATFVTGGKVLGARTTGIGQIRGTGIDGGDIHQLKKGDVIVIPAGTSHWIKSVNGIVDYLVIKVLS